MSVRPSLKTAALGAAALSTVAMLLAPATASAQVHSYQGGPRAYESRGYGQPSYGHDSSGYGYDQSAYGSGQQGYGQDRSYNRSGQDYCQTGRSQRQGAGVAVGATFGAILGSQFGARGRRTEGSVLGALIGGALGAAVASDPTHGCQSQARFGYDYNDRGDSDPSRFGYADRGYGNQTYRDQTYGDPYRASDHREDRGDRYQPDNRYTSDCRPVAVNSRDRFGRLVTRYQQTC